MVQKRSAHLMQVGEELEPLELFVTPELNQQYLYAEEDFHPRYITGENGNEAWVHPGLLLNMSNYTRSPSFYLDPEYGSLHAGEETEFINPARVGKKVTITWKIAKTYLKRGRFYQEVDIHLVDEDGVPIMRRNLICTYTSVNIIRSVG